MATRAKKKKKTRRSKRVGRPVQLKTMARSIVRLRADLSLVVKALIGLAERLARPGGIDPTIVLAPRLVGKRCKIESVEPFEPEPWKRP